LTPLDLPARQYIAFSRIRILASLELQPERRTFELQHTPEEIEQVTSIVAR
jgi:hypothetical protein